MIIVKLLSIIIILCVVILLIQLLQLCTMKTDNEIIEKFDEGSDESMTDMVDIDKVNIEKVSKDLDDIELSTNNMLLKIKSLKSTIGAKTDRPIMPFKDYIKKQMERLKSVREEEVDAEDNESTMSEVDEEDYDGDVVEGFVDGLSHNCSAYH